MRGILVLAMIVYHLLYDLKYIFDVPLNWFKSDMSVILIGFLLVSGFSFTLGKRRAVRAAQVSVCGLLVTLVTCLFMPSQKILFGVLTCIGVCMFLMIPMEKPLSKIPPGVGIALFAILTILTYGVRFGYIGIYNHPLFDLPQSWYETSFLFPFGLKNGAFHSSDYVPLLPWFFTYICGYMIARAVKSREKATAVLRWGIKPLARIGRYSLWIYMAHQPIVYAILWLIFKTSR